MFWVEIPTWVTWLVNLIHCPVWHHFQVLWTTSSKVHFIASIQTISTLRKLSLLSPHTNLRIIGTAFPPDWKRWWLGEGGHISYFYFTWLQNSVDIAQIHKVLMFVWIFFLFDYYYDIITIMSCYNGRNIQC